MQYRYLSLISGFMLALGACDAAPPQDTTSAHPFAGCWQTDNGLEREVWLADPSGWMFGHAASRNRAGEITFFEHMRLEVSGEGASLVVIGSSGDIVRFDREPTDIGDAEYKFVNASHDYPQVITYVPSAGRLDAEISLLDGSKAKAFKKRACDNLQTAGL